MPIGLLVRLSYRNLFRHARRNTILLVSIAVAIAGVVFLNALLRGMQADLVDSARVNLTGDYRITAPGYLEDPQAARGFELTPHQIEQLDGLWPGRWSARLVVPMVISSERKNRGVLLVGIDPQQEAGSFFADVEFVGETVAHARSTRLFVGKELLTQLRSGIGKRVVLTGQDESGTATERGFTIGGAFDAEGKNLEQQFVFIGRGALQGFLSTSLVTEVSILLSNPGHSSRVQDQLHSIFRDLTVTHWRESNAQTAALIDMMEFVSLIWFSIVMAALAFGLVNALVTAVMERHREFGVMRCLGMQRSTVLSQVMIESFFIMLTGVVLGMAAGWAGVSMAGGEIDLGRFAEGVAIAGLPSVISLQIHPEDLVSVILLSCVFGVLASLVPAWRANRQPLLQAIAQ